MIDINLQRELGRQILTVTGENKDGISDKADFRERMLSYNRVDGVLPFEVVRQGEEKTYEYNIEGKSTLEEFFTREKPDSTRITAVFRELLKIVYRGREYMLSEDGYIIKADTVFVDEDDKVCVPYCPLYHEDLRQQLANLAEYLMRIVDYSDESAVLLVYGFYMRTKEKEFTLEDLLKSLVPEGKKPKIRTGEIKGANDLITRTNDCVAGMNDHITGTDERITGTNDRVTGIKGHITVENDHVTGANEKIIGTGSGTTRNRKASDTAGFAHFPVKDSKEYVKSDPIKVFSQSPIKVKLVGLLIPPAAVLIIFAVLASGILLNSATGRNDVIKSGFVVLAVIGVGIEAEKLLWSSFAKKLAGSIVSAEKEAEEATVFLYGDDSVGYPFSLVSDDQPPINVSHFPFFVGKDASHCDYVMATQVGISRYHMKIDRDGDEFTISDLNSTNGTFINGERLAPHLPHKIKRGDELKIGRCIFYCN